MEKNQIFITMADSLQESTIALLESCGLSGMIPARDCLIGIKPNLVSASDASCGATTHPEIVEGIILYLREKGFWNLCMLEGSWAGARTADAFTLCGYKDLSERYQVPFYDMQREKSIAVDCGGMLLNICKKALEIDFLINVPVLKGHCQTRITCALKNMKGLIPNSEKRRFHSLGLHRPIAHLNTAIHQDFILVDNICGDLDFEDGGNPVVMNRILAACDPVLIDSYVCHLMHYQTEDVAYIGLAEKLGVGCADLKAADIRMVGEGSSGELPLSRKVVEVQDKACEVESCSACYGYLIPALNLLKEEGLLDRLTEKICIGQGFRGQKGALGVGHCTSGFLHHLEGCPPTEQQMYCFLKEYIENHDAH